MNRTVTFAFALFLAMLIIPSAFALVSVSQMGYHPSSVKTATYYTSASSGTFDILQGTKVVKSGALAKAQDADGNPVECQGNNPCLIADFSDVTAAGTYKVRVTAGGKTETSVSFPISADIYRTSAQVFNGFFDAQRQKGSTYHADMNTFANPAFPAMADGSFLMRAHQAGWTLIRLGNAYRRDPQMLDNAAVTTITSYADYLADLQDAKIQENNDGVGFRTEDWLSPQSAFVPGPTNMTELTVYNDNGTPIKTVPVRSLCAANGTTDAACMDFAAKYYKCQADEPCIELSYIGKTGQRVNGTDGLGVDSGWYYSWSCYYDVDLVNGNYNNKPNPCMVYDATESDFNTAIALLAWTEAITPINTKDPAKAKALLDRAELTQGYLKGRSLDADEKGYFGAASFLLYDMTGDKAYLQDAYNVRTAVEPQLKQDRMRGSEFYWQEYITHKAALTANGMSYNAGVDPENVFSGHVIFDYANGGDDVKISKNGERVYDVQRNYGFSNSRAILSTSIFASKALDLTASAPAYAREIADQQISWITGNNGVDMTISPETADMQSMSFIIGIGSNMPTQIHSRLLQNSGYAAATAGALKGMHGTGLKYMENGQLVYLDGKTTILGEEFGGQGNGRGGETITPFLDGSKKFKNGKSVITGWINGPFDSEYDQDVIYNYEDNRNTYEFTETENDMVGTAVEAFAYEDALHNSVAALAVPQLRNGGIVIPPAPVTNTTNTTNTTNSTNTTNATLATLNIKSVPAGADVRMDNVYKGMTPALGYLSFTAAAGTHALVISKIGYQNITDSVLLAPAGNTTKEYALVAISNTTTNTTNTTNVTVTPGAPSLLSQKGENMTAPCTDQCSMLETGTGIFTVQFNQSTHVDWYVNDVLVASQNTADGRSVFAWNPTILYSGSKDGRDAKVRATANGATHANFTVHVGEVINPFWEGDFGSSSAIVHVFTQNNVKSYTNVIVSLENGRTKTSVPLTYEYASEAETDWKATLADMKQGDTIITAVTVEDNRTGYVETFPVGGHLAHYRKTTTPQSTSGGAGGGGAGEGPNTPPEFVYAVFSKDMIAVGESVTLSIDARDNEEVRSVNAVITHDDGQADVIPLALTNGAKGYGTWTATITGVKPGKYTLSEVVMTDNTQMNATAKVGDRGFYVLGDTVLSGENLMLVYALLNQSTIMPGDEIGIKADVRDFQGVESVEVMLKSKDQEIPVKLKLTSGDNQYGTWEGKVKLDTADTTYALVMARMTNANETKETRVYGQKVYVQYVKPAELIAQENAPQPSKTELRQIVRNPVTPLLIGLIGMGLAMLIVSSMTFMKKEE